MIKNKLPLTKLFILICFLFLGISKINASVNPFVTTWKTDNAGTSNSTSITIPTTGTGYSYDIDWNNDGTYDQFGATGSVTHDFLVVGTYTIAIRGSFPRIYFNNGGDKLKLLSITAWGSIAWTSMNSAFYGCSNLTIPATDAPNFTAVTDMSSMFRGCTSFNQPLSSSFNTSAVTNMYLMFSGCTAYNQALPSSFNTSAVTNMSAMFYGCTAYNQALPSNFNTSAVTNMNGMFNGCVAFNQTLPSIFNTSAVTNMSTMFYGCKAYNQPLPSSFNTSAVTDMSYMFGNCSSFNQALPSSFNTSAVTNMSQMFLACTAYNQALPSSFNTSAVTNMSGMFNGCTAYNQPLPSSFNTSAVTNMSNMFTGCAAYNQALPSSFNTSTVTNMIQMFYGCTAFNQALPNSFSTSAVTNMSAMFYNCTAYNQPLSISFNTSAVTNMSYMFRGCTAFNQALPSSFNTSAVTNMSNMFTGCAAFNQALPSSFNTSAVTNMSSMFRNCTSYNQALPSSFNTSAVTNMNNMFSGCTAYNQTLPSSFNTSAVTDMSYMFFGCAAFNQALPSTFNTSTVTNMSYMFYNCTAYNQALPSSFNTSAVTTMNNMFTNCNSFNQALPSSFNTSAVTNMSQMFSYCTAFNQALPSSFNTSAVNNMSNMFLSCTAFNQNIGSWNIGAATTLSNIFNFSGISQATYDSILIRWNNAGYTNKNLGNASPLIYCAGAAARASLITKGWTITNDTLVCPCTPDTSTQSTTICSTQLPYSYLGHTMSAAGNDTLHLTNTGGCDSLAILVLTVTHTAAPIVISNLIVNITGGCSGISGVYNYTGLVNGKNNYLAVNNPNYQIGFDGTKWVHYSNNKFNITGFQNTNVPAGLYPPTTGWVATQCPGGSMTITLSNTFCSATTVANLSATGTNLKWYSAATGGTALATTTAVSTTGTYYVSQTINGCESPRTAVAVTVNPSTNNATRQIACGNYTWNGANYTNSGTYTYNYNNANGCPSVDTLYLTINIPTTYYADVDGDGYGNAAISQLACSKPTGYVSNSLDCNDNLFNSKRPAATSSVVSRMVCYGDSILYNGKYYKTHNTYLVHFTNSAGCDSIVYLAINYKYPTTGYVAKTICLGDSFQYNNVYYKIHNTYKVHLTNHVGCDSLVYLTINYNYPTVGYLAKTICLGDSFLYNNIYYKVHNTYKVHLRNHVGCDSLVYLTINYNYPTVGYVVQTVCLGDSIQYYGKYYKTHNTYKVHLTNHVGCDSLVYLTINYKYPTSGYLVRNICAGDSVLYNGKYYKIRNTYKFHFTNHVGCDSTVYFTLNYNNSSSIKNDTFCPNVAPYLFGTHLYTAAGHYSLHYTNYKGCDSIAYLNLVVRCATRLKQPTEQENTEVATTTTSFNIYPNPSSGEFTVETNCSNCGKMKIEILNLQGQVVYTSNKDNANGRMELSPNLIAGMYWIKVSSAENNYLQMKSIVITK